MIIYFSGTGNSRYVAEQIGKITGEEVISLNALFKHHSSDPVAVNGKLVFAIPTYAWRIPHIVEQWIQRTSFTGADKAWFVMTCGTEIGNAAKYSERLCKEKKFSYMGTMQIIMPENYIAMFGAPGKEEADRIIADATPSIELAAERIMSGTAFDRPRNNLYDRIMSSAVNPVFYKFCIKASLFTAGEKCIGCGKCAELCPLDNITMQDGRPKWGSSCTHCMACICHCPMETIEYGNKSVGKPRYHCD